MIRALNSAALGMIAQQTNIDTIANNMANINTAGFKKSRAEFQDLLYAEVQRPMQGLSTGLMVGQGTRVSGIQRILAGGGMQVTGNPYDLAIQGSGYFRVQQEDGSVAYTRDGSFHLDGEGQLVTAQGGLVLGENGPIKVPAEAKTAAVNADGGVVWSDAKNQNTEAGKVSLALFANPSGLTAAGDNLFLESAASGQAQGTAAGQQDAGRLSQGYLEASNVEAAEEMINLMQAQRAYQLNSRVIQSADEMLGMANNLRRG
jgi:flagellar basal-body rod protein FlgG